MYFGALDGDSASSLFEGRRRLVPLIGRGRRHLIPGRSWARTCEFVDALIRKLPQGGYIEREQQRLIRTIDEGCGRPMIKVTAVEKSFKDVKAPMEVDFEVERGSIFALLGSNGAGKTTLRGSCPPSPRLTPAPRANGADVASDPAGVRESISVTGQSTAVDGILTGRENLMLIARLRHLPDPGDRRRTARPLPGSRRRRGARCPRTRRNVPPVGHRHEPHRRPPVLFSMNDHGLDPQSRLEVWRIESSRDKGTHHPASPPRIWTRPNASPITSRSCTTDASSPTARSRNSSDSFLRDRGYVTKQPTLEDVFLAIVGEGNKPDDRTFRGDTAVLLGRSLRPSHAASTRS